MTHGSNSTGRKSTLALIGLLFLLSALVRLSTEAGQAFAREQALPVSNEVPETARTEQTPESLAQLLEALKEREARLVAREEDVAMRERTVEVVEAEIDKQLERLERAENSLKETITLASQAAETDLAQLTDVYANMKPKQAAALFEQMDARFAAGFLARMPSDSAARVLAGMTPEKAYHVSVELAGRNADIPLD